MDFMNDFDCPQYVNFKTEFNINNISLSDARTSSCSVKDDIEMESIEVNDENHDPYYSKERISYAESNQSTLSESYLSDCNSQESRSQSDYLAEEFPINRPKNLSLPEKEIEKNIKSNQAVIKPSHLTESKKRKREDQHIPLAEQIVAFHKKTPQRFHTTGSKAFEPLEHWSRPLTHPKSPNLKAAKRRRCVNVLSREEQEAKEAEEMKRYRFHAQPVKYDKYFSSQLPKVGKKLPTKAKTLHLRTAQRADEVYAKKKEIEKPVDVEFRARPVPKSILSGPTGLKSKPSLRVTEAKTPNFALKKRAEKWRSESKLNESAPSIKFKAAPAPDPASYFSVKHEKIHTEVEPFSFDSKDKERMAKKAQKIAEEIENENRVYVFKAKSLPSPAPSALPAIQKKPLTNIEPFNFYSDGLNFKQSRFNSPDQKCPSFKAQPATVLEKPPFVPEKLPKLPPEIKEFYFHTDIRAAEHEKLKEINDVKEREKELALQRLKKIQEEEERQEILKIRKEAVHKANPIRHYKPVEIKPSHKLPTQPISPKFHTDERLRNSIRTDM